MKCRISMGRPTLMSCLYYLIPLAFALHGCGAYDDGTRAANEQTPSGGNHYSDGYEPPGMDPEGPPDKEEPEEDDEWAWFQLSPDDSTSMATAQLLKLNDSAGRFHLKPHEVVNYYDPPAMLREGEPFARQWTTEEGILVGIEGQQVHPQGEETAGSMELFIHLYAPQVPVEERRPWNLHLCVDVSGSMDWQDRMDFTRQALLKLLMGMRPGDRLSLTTFESSGRVVFPSMEWQENREEMKAHIQALAPGGGTNMMSGLTLAYAEAQREYDPQAINRVLLFSDGDANVGNTEIESFAQLTRINNLEGIYLSGVGVGSDYALERMNALTDAGKGAHVFLPHAQEVEVIFGEMLRKMIEVAVDEVSVEIQLPNGFTLRDFSGEEYSTDPDARVPNIVLAAGDDISILATFEAEDERLLEGDMILTVSYRPLMTAALVAMEEQFPIGDILREDQSLLMERTRLVDAYGRWGCGVADEDFDACGLLSTIRDFSPNDLGLSEIEGLMSSRLTCE